MRLFIDTLIALMALGLLGGVLWMRSDDAELERGVEKVRRSLEALHTTAQYHGALGHLSNSPAGYPVHMMPDWFPEPLPVNALLSKKHPWIDLAPPGDNAIHPPDPVASREDQAGFWYNPNAGVFRARVPAEGGSKQKLELYNRVNHTDLAALPASDDEHRMPQAYHPAAAFTAHASNYAPGGNVEGRATNPDGEDVLIIEWVSGDPAQPPITIHELPDRWTVPQANDEASDAQDVAPHTEDRNATAPETAEGSDHGAESMKTQEASSSDSDSAPGSRPARRPTLSDLKSADDAP